MEFQHTAKRIEPDYKQVDLDRVTALPSRFFTAAKCGFNFDFSKNCIINKGKLDEYEENNYLK